MAAFQGMHGSPANHAMRDYQEIVTTGQTDGQTDAGQSDPYVPLCFAGNTKKYHMQTHRLTELFVYKQIRIKV